MEQLSTRLFFLLRLLFVSLLPSRWPLYLLAFALGVLLRAAVRTRRDFRTLTWLGAAAWVICELIVDTHEMFVYLPESALDLYSLCVFVGIYAFWFTVGLLAGHLFCTLLRRRPLGAAE